MRLDANSLDCQTSPISPTEKTEHPKKDRGSSLRCIEAPRGKPGAPQGQKGCSGWLLKREAEGGPRPQSSHQRLCGDFIFPFLFSKLFCHWEVLICESKTTPGERVCFDKFPILRRGGEKHGKKRK